MPPAPGAPSSLWPSLLSQYPFILYLPFPSFPAGFLHFILSLLALQYSQAQIWYQDILLQTLPHTSHDCTALKMLYFRGLTVSL